MHLSQCPVGFGIDRLTCLLPCSPSLRMMSTLAVAGLDLLELVTLDGLDLQLEHRT